MSSSDFFGRLGVLCRGRSGDIGQWLRDDRWTWLGFCFLVVTIGCAFYGATIGVWRGALQALYAGIKLPLLICLTTILTALLNWMLALVLGARFTFRQVLLALFMGYTIAALIFAALVPVALFVTWHLPALSAAGRRFSHSVIVVMHVAIIAWAGSISTFRLHSFIRTHGSRRSLAGKVLFAWLLGSMFVGCQLSWNLRPFMGSPGLEIQFLRPDAFAGNFYVALYGSLKRIVTETRDAGEQPSDADATRTRSQRQAGGFHK
ncbi:MAG: hypothetical protein JXR37_31965 [Kiritimatiellae bacterium]|nr:hypothetical protein [Kiritimatiellia bacterium]